MAHLAQRVPPEGTMAALRGLTTIQYMAPLPPAQPPPCTMAASPTVRHKEQRVLTHAPAAAAA